MRPPPRGLHAPPPQRVLPVRLPARLGLPGLLSEGAAGHGQVMRGTHNPTWQSTAVPFTASPAGAPKAQARAGGRCLSYPWEPPLLLP